MKASVLNRGFWAIRGRSFDYQRQSPYGYSGVLRRVVHATDSGAVLHDSKSVQQKTGFGGFTST